MQTRMLAIVMCLLGCADADPVVAKARRCVEDHPATPRELASVSYLGGALQDCISDEARDCDTDGLIAPSAAECIAREEGLAEGLDGVRVNLYYSAEFRRLTWSVSNTLYERGSDGEGGASIMVDAITGAILGMGGWSQTP